MRDKTGIVKKFFRNYKTSLVYIITFMIIFGTLVTSVITKKYDLKVGDIAPTTIKAPKEVKDEKSTEAKRNEIAQKIPKQYTINLDIQEENVKKLEEFFAKVKEIIVINSAIEDENAPRQTITGFDEFNLSEEDKIHLLNASDAQLDRYEKIILKVLNEAYENEIKDDKPDILKNTKEAAILKINELSGSNDKSLLTKISLALIKPNSFYDQDKTNAVIEEAKSNVEDIIYQKDQTVVKEGEPISESQLEVLDKLGILNNSKASLYLYSSLAIMVILILYIQHSYLKKYQKDIYNDFSKLVMINVINIISVVFGRVFSIISPYLIPLACMPMLLTLLLDYKISTVLSVINIIFLAVAVKFSPNIIIIAIVATILGCTSLKKMQQRNDILYSSIFISALTGIITLCITILGTTNELKEALINTIFTIVGGLLSGVLATGLLPFFEATFDIVTTVKLLELANPNNPLMRKLLMEAPGTYHHSVLVANLAEVATEAVGGNALLARIGAYYHDVGKTKRPYFFRENQIGKDNPHDKITQNLSTIVIISHVKDGLDLAKEYNLPTAIQDFIATHQGDTLVKYFYLTAKNNAENPDDVKMEDYMYPGPRPKTKEQGILMLADSVEAAVRSINDPTQEKIEAMVENIVKDKLSSNQLDNCELTFRDVDIIKKSFLKVLSGIYHQRIEYPTDNTKKE